MGAVRRAGAAPDGTSVTRDRIIQLRYDPRGALVGVLAAGGRALEVLRVRTPEEAARRHRRRANRAREKRAKKATAGGDAAVTSVPDPGVLPSADDEFDCAHVLRPKGRARGFTFAPSPPRGRAARVALSLATNALVVYDLAVMEGTGWADELVGGVDQPGHRGDVRAVALAPTGTLLVSCGPAAVKVWDAATGACIRTLPTGAGLCAAFAPSGRHAVIGTRAGGLELLDLAAGATLEFVAAHTGPVWAIAALPSGTGLISASADKDVKFWEYELRPPPSDSGADAHGAPQLALRHTRTLTMSDDVMAASIGPGGTLLALALLDSTIKVLFTDTLKFFLSLYGHKLPALCLSMSSDGALLASGSADKSVRLWGLDFGTHYLFSCGKDGLVKYWDGDRFELLLALPGHHGEVWGLAVSPGGDYVVTAAHDRALRKWSRTEEPFFLEEERERRLESLFDAGAEDAPVPGAGAAAAEGDGPVVSRTADALGAADGILDALELAAHEEAQPDGVVANPLLLGMSASDFVLRAVAGVRPSEVEQALLMLPFGSALGLLRRLPRWLDGGQEPELCCRVAGLLLRLHQRQLTATPAARTVLLALRQHLRPRVQGLKDVLGRNLAAIHRLLKGLGQRQAGPSA